jgi:ABC-type uncharacterized transport system substrate-binding protein
MKLLTLIVLLSISLYAKNDRLCVYISSYHQGFAWSDGIEKAVKSTLKDKCKIIQYNMDTKRYKEDSYIKGQALNAKNFIDALNPDVVITSDDNAAKYLITPYYKDSSIPFVFSGVNWTVEKYGFPFRNVTGMIEVTPIKQLFDIADEIVSGKKAIFIGDNTITDKKDLARFKKDAKLANIQLDDILVDKVSQWKKAYKEAQTQYDYVILGHNAAIKGWNDDDIKKFVYKNTKILSLTTYTWMMEFSTIGLTILSSEQGEWSAKTALAILDGYKVEDIAITTNKQWDIWLNSKIQNVSEVSIPRKIRLKAKKIR